jgi:hypothetical protein
MLIEEKDLPIYISIKVPENEVKLKITEIRLSQHFSKERFEALPALKVMGYNYLHASEFNSWFGLNFFFFKR